MQRYDRPAIGLAMGLSGLAGFVDALGFLSLGGFFVSFMTGNTTRLGIELAQGRLDGILLAGMIIVLFVLGVVCGSLAGHAGGRRRQAAVLAFVTLTLALSAGLDTLGLGGFEERDAYGNPGTATKSITAPAEKPVTPAKPGATDPPKKPEAPKKP